MDYEEYDDFDEPRFPYSDYDNGYNDGKVHGASAALAEMSEDEIVRLLESKRRESIISRLNPYDNYGTEGIDEDGEFYMHFANPGENSALRAAHAGNPRILPCPTCGRENVLTPADRARGYQCNRCADRDEGIYMGGDY